jgi:hypothetical protein
MKAFAGKTQYYQDGMDLRDYFAARAMQGLLNTALNENVPKDQVAEVAYKIADSMMKARSK